MKIILNQQPIELDLKWPLTWGQFFQQLMQGCRHFPKDHGIVRLLVDGEDSLFLISDGTAKHVPEEVKEVEIFTADSVSIIKLGFERASALVAGIKDETDLAVSLYREDKKEEASAKVVGIMEAFKSIVSFIHGVAANYQINFETVVFNGDQSLMAKLQDIGNTLSQLGWLQREKDWVAVANMLENRFSRDLADWQTLITILFREVESRSVKA
jgi:hypothetical protein